MPKSSSTERVYPRVRVVFRRDEWRVFICHDDAARDEVGTGWADHPSAYSLAHAIAHGPSGELVS